MFILVFVTYTSKIAIQSTPPEKPFLFEIVANKRNGIDVDKSVVLILFSQALTALYLTIDLIILPEILTQSGTKETYPYRGTRPVLNSYFVITEL